MPLDAKTYSAITPIHNVNKKSYTEFLKKKFPEKKMIFRKEKREKETGFVIEGCFEPIAYQSFFVNKKFDYPKFIQYLSDTTFEPLSHNALIESQKSKLAKAFINLLTRYLEEE